jgi:hypothetical protein
MAQALIHRAKNLQKYAVELELTEPLRLNGVIPFDISIKDHMLVAKVYAVDFDEAVSMVHNYLESLE